MPERSTKGKSNYVSRTPGKDGLIPYTDEENAHLA